MSSELKNIIESLMMVSEVPLSVSKIQSVFDSDAAPTADDVKSAIKDLQEDCAGRSVEVRKIGSGYRLQTRPQYAEWIRKLQAGRPPRLSRAQLETLAIIAYRQPVTRGDIEEIRGVAVSADIMQRLTERDWIKQVGMRDVPGRPALFGTTAEFLSYFNLGSLKDLPPLMEQREFSEIAKDLDVPLPPEILAALEGEPLETQQDMFEAPEDGEQDDSQDSDQDAMEGGTRNDPVSVADQQSPEEEDAASLHSDDVREAEVEEVDIHTGVLEPDAEKT